MDTMIYFPLIVPEALMIEPTETESPETLEDFADVVKEILANPEKSKVLPQKTPVKRVDEVHAARHLVLTRKDLI